MGAKRKYHLLPINLLPFQKCLCDAKHLGEKYKSLESSLQKFSLYPSNYSIKFVGALSYLQFHCSRGYLYTCTNITEVKNNMNATKGANKV